MIADGEIVHAVADRRDDACAFVSQHQGQGIGNRAVGGRQIAVTNAAGSQAHGHLAMARRRHFDLFHDHGFAEFAHHYRFRQLSH